MQEDYVSIAQSIALKYIEKDTFAVFLFGSRARKDNLHSADIDVGIWGEEKVSFHSHNCISEELLESVVPYSMDVIDSYCADDQFRKIALKSYQIWNLPKHLKLKLSL